jgi:glyoxylase-like metal-dependent hydrolase (beta-lactamase superfamily II)/rhodanese-related sulfurtransferase
MFFRQVLYRDLGCASYVLGDHDDAVVVDPRWDIDVYLDIAREEGLQIAHVIDTHDHADHVSGRLRLAEATGARAYRPDPENKSPDRISPGDEIAVGSLRVRAIATPGHRPEHLTFAIIDLARGPEPWMLLTGDSLLVGDIARPDLAVDAATGAQLLQASLAELVALGDHVEVWPAHVGGSLCGGAGLSGKTSSTVGFERLHNPLLMLDEERFVTGLTASLPSRPPNVERVVSLNKRPEFAAPPELRRLTAEELRDLLAASATVLDSRSPEEFDTGHLAGSLNLPIGAPGVGTRAGWALDPDERLVIVARDAADAQEMESALQAVGFVDLAGYTLADVWAWEHAGLPVAQAGAWTLEQLADGLRADTVELVDVREPSEWEIGHVPGSHSVPLSRLRDVSRAPATGNGRVTAVACAGGRRAAFAASVLRRAGRQNIVRVAEGGVPSLVAYGIDLEPGLD